MDESIVKHLEQQQITKLSQAIRIGARLRPQCFDGNIFSGGKSCAIGAAYEGVTGRTFKGPRYSRVEEIFPDLTFALTEQIWMWNDSDGLTREQIADKLEKLGY